MRALALLLPLFLATASLAQSPAQSAAPPEHPTHTPPTAVYEPAPARPTQDDPYVLRSTTNLVLVPAQIQTKKGDMLYGLRRDQFLVEDNGVPQTIRLDEDTDALGLSLVVVVQCSRRPSWSSTT